jgi:ribosome-associated protein
MDFEPEKSKSKVKRELRALQDLGCELLELPEKNLARLPLSGQLIEAIRETRPMRRGARQRQLRYIGGLLAREDLEAIDQALHHVLRSGREADQHFHEVEKWRDELLVDGEEAIDRVIARLPGAERQRLRRLVRNARKEQLGNRPPKSARLLFRYLRDLLSAAAS